MPEPVRVRDNDTGHEYSTYAVDENGKSYDGLTVLDEPAVDATGTLLPPKYPAPDTSEVAEVATAAEETDVAGDEPATADTAVAPEPEPTTASAAKQSTKAPRPIDPKTTPKES